MSRGVWNPLGSVSSATPPARHWGISQHPGPGSASLKRPTEYLFAKFALVSGWHLGLAAGDHARHASCTKVLTRRHVPCPMTISTEVLAVLADVLETREVYDAPDLPLYELDLLDSLRTVELLLALSERLGIEISPAEIDRELWGSPRRIVKYVERRVESTRPGNRA
jgi:D-alanine--poly(phosphoribitol) ligase subunit 2